MTKRIDHLERKCKNCGKIFEVWRTKRWNHISQTKFCCKACIIFPGRPPLPPIKKKCGFCGNNFLVSRRSVSRAYAPNGKKYCSLECQTKARCKNGVDVPKINDVQAAYIAAFLDGEGSIIVTRNTRNRRLACFKLAFYNSHLGALKTMQKWCGGVGSIPMRMDATEKWQEQYSWTISSYPAHSILLQIIPYMIVKLEKALEAIEIYKEISETRKHTYLFPSI